MCAQIRSNDLLVVVMLGQEKLASREPTSSKRVKWDDEVMHFEYVYDRSLNTRYIDFAPMVVVMSVCMPMLPLLLAATFDYFISSP